MTEPLAKPTNSSFKWAATRNVRGWSTKVLSESAVYSPGSISFRSSQMAVSIEDASVAKSWSGFMSWTLISWAFIDL